MNIRILITNKLSYNITSLRTSNRYNNKEFIISNL